MSERKIDEATMDNVEILAKLALTPQERQKAMDEMEKILTYVEKLNELDTDQAEPLVHILPDVNVFREHIVNTVERARKVLDAIDSPNLQIIFDPVNLLYVGNIDKQDEIINQAFDLLLKDIAVVHCKDYVVEGDELKSIAAGTGGLNYPLLLKKIKEHKPYVHCTLENTVPENAVATREFMEKLYSEV